MQEGLVDVILSTPIEKVAECTVDRIRSSLLGRPSESPHLDFRIYTSENIP